MKAIKPEVIIDADTCVDAVITQVGKRIVMALPLALGNPVISSTPCIVVPRLIPNSSCIS